MSLYRQTIYVSLTVIALAGTGWLDAQERLVDVIVRNLPVVQEVKGSISIEKPTSHAAMVRFEDLIVSPAERHNTNRLQYAGVLESDGFTSVVLSLTGEIKGTAPAAAVIGVLLVPDEELVVEAFEAGHLLLPIELPVSIKANASAYVAASGLPAPIAFPRYRVYLYNTGKRTIRAQLFAYLTH